MTAEGRFDNHCGSSIHRVGTSGYGFFQECYVFLLMICFCIFSMGKICDICGHWALGVPPLSGKAMSRIISNPVFLDMVMNHLLIGMQKYQSPGKGWGGDGGGCFLSSINIHHLVMPSLRQWTIHFARKIFETCASDIPSQLMIHVRLLFSKKNMKALIALACRIILYRFKT